MKIPLTGLILLLSLYSVTESKKHRTTTTIKPIKPQKPNKYGSIGSTLYSLSLYMDNEQIIDFMIDNAFGTNNYIRQHFGMRFPEIKLATIQRMLELEPLTVFDVALDDLEINYADFKSAFIAYHPTYNLIQLLGISFSAAVDNFLAHLENNSQTLFKVLKLINVDPEVFTDTVKNKGEEDCFNLLADGSYEEANLKEVLTLAKLDVTFSNIVTILGLTKDFTTKFAMNVDGSFTGIMRKLKIDPENLKSALKNFNYAESNEPSMITPIPAILEDLEDHESVATQISEYKAVTHKDCEVLTKFRDLAPSVTLVGTNLADDRKIELIPNTLNPTEANYATLWSENSMGLKFTPLALTDEIQGRKEYTDCAYWFVDDQFTTQISVTPTLKKYAFDVQKSNAGEVLLDGTPLVCDGKLYALTVNDLAGKTDAIFVSKYPIMKRDSEESTGFFGSIFNMVKNFYKGVFKFFTWPYRFVKDIISGLFKN